MWISDESGMARKDLFRRVTQRQKRAEIPVFWSSQAEGRLLLRQRVLKRFALTAVMFCELQEEYFIRQISS